MIGLDNLFAKYHTDKHSGRHGYDRFYEEELANRDIRQVLEVGIGGGGSLLAWAEAWPRAHVYGVDISHILNPMQHPRIHIVRADATTPIVVSLLPLDGFDFIVDDASHVLQDQVTTARLLFPLLRHGGTYVIEDVVSRDHALALCQAWLPDAVSYSVVETSKRTHTTHDDRIVAIRK